MLPWLLAAVLGAGGPQGELTVQTDAFTATMTSRGDWTLRTLEYHGAPILTDAGGEGAVIFPRGGGWLGGGMAPDGEQVHSLAIDGAAVEDLPPGPLGEGAVIEKASNLAGIEQTAVTRFEGDLIVQEHTFTFAEDQDLKSFYPFIYSFSTEFTQWMAESQTGQESSGEFIGDGGHPVVTPVSWVALYNAGASVAVIAYHQRPTGGSTSLWDAAGYRKFYVRPMSGQIAAGTEVSGTLVLKCFAADADDWQEAARREVAALQQQFPAEEAEAQPNQLYDEGVPEQGMMTVQTEHLRAIFEAPSAWTLDEIWYDGIKLAGPTGHYGTVLVPAGGAWIGTGHTEGGREVVHSLQMTVDGAEQPVQVGATIEGGEVTLVKRSTIHLFDATHTVTVLGDEIVERAQLTATEDHVLSLMYLFMHCIEPATTRWVAETPDGEIVEGTFESDKDMELERDARWAAEWFPEHNIAVVMYLTRIPEPDTSRVMMWDQERYHKFYVQHSRSLSVSEGDELDFTLVFRVVPNETGDWSAVKAAAADLAERYPPVDAE